MTADVLARFVGSSTVTVVSAPYTSISANPPALSPDSMRNLRYLYEPRFPVSSAPVCTQSVVPAAFLISGWVGYFLSRPGKNFV